LEKFRTIPSAAWTEQLIKGRQVILVMAIFRNSMLFDDLDLKDVIHFTDGIGTGELGF
jgi:hypothetical protein